MKKDLSEKIKIPEGIEVRIVENMVTLKKADKELKRKFENLEIKKEDSEINIGKKNATKRDKKNIMTTSAHILNMINGLQENFVYKLQICFVHFPTVVTVDEEKNEIVIKNFLGEVKPRVAKILPNVDVKIENDIISLESYDKEAAGQTAGNIEGATKISSRDRRIFQDGIFIIEKAKGKKKERAL